MNYKMSNQKIIIAVDGFSSTGKSTLAKEMARELTYGYIDTGAMYRAVTLFFLRNEVDIKDGEAVRLALIDIEISFQNINGKNTTFLNGENVEEEIRKMYVSEFVSPVATVSQVRRDMVKLQKAMGDKKGIVMDGRDIGTVVFQNAELKIFVTADPDVRANRRLKELEGKGQAVDFEDVKKNLTERDYIDSHREDSPLRQAEDAVVLDNTDLTREVQLEMAVRWAREIIEGVSC
ncbi:MAG: cytidylate kinase [Saprospiraceae bacterium]|jgi:cytidylate kinase